MLSPMVSTAVLAASITEVNPGLTFWTIITFLVVFLVLRWKAWGPMLQMVREREKAIQDAIDSAKRERKEAERMLEEQKQAIAQARREAAELIRKNHAEVEKAREEMIARSRKEAEELVAQAVRQIDEEKTRAMTEVRDHAVELAIAGARKLVESSLDDKHQRELVGDYLNRLDAETRQKSLAG